jgi:DNA-binding MarR family transcriptional regulator
MANKNSFRTTSHVLGNVTLLGRLVQERIGMLLDPYDLTHAQAVALVRLWRSPEGSMPQANLIRSLAVSRATGTQLLHDLERRGLVMREPDTGDARRHVVALTNDGIALEAEVLSVFDQVETEIVGSVPDADWQHLAGGLIAMTDRARQSKGPT